jgi:hypothetical protein
MKTLKEGVQVQPDPDAQTDDFEHIRDKSVADLFAHLFRLLRSKQTDLAKMQTNLDTGRNPKLNELSMNILMKHNREITFTLNELHSRVGTISASDDTKDEDKQRSH